MPAASALSPSRSQALMTERGRGALALAGVAYLGAWTFGAEILYPVSVGLLAVFSMAFVWVRLLKRPMSVRRRVGYRELTAGDDVPVNVELEVRARRLPPAAVTLTEQVESLGPASTSLRPRRSGLFVGHYVLHNVPRGRYSIRESRVVCEDPFSLERLEVSLPGQDTLLVYPRLVELESLFSDSGQSRFDGRQHLLHRPSGFDLHSVRPYEQGESLRRVHWPSTARAGQLMVKEMEDSPREEVSVILDAYAVADVGAKPESSFEVAVSAAGSLLQAYAKRGRRSALTVNGRERRHQRLQEGDWQAALGVLAAVEADGAHPVERMLDESSQAMRSLELVVVTSWLSPRLVERLLRRRRQTSLVYVEPSSFAGATRLSRLSLEQSALLARLEREGLPVALVRRGDDLQTALGGARG